MNERSKHSMADPVKSCRDLPTISNLSKIKNERWVTVQEAAEFMGVKNINAVRVQVRKGRIRGARFGGGLIVKLVDVHKFVRLRNKGAFRRGGRPRKDKG